MQINSNQPEDAEPSNEEESIGDENEPLPQQIGQIRNKRLDSQDNGGRQLKINNMFQNSPDRVTSKREVDEGESKDPKQKNE